VNVAVIQRVKPERFRAPRPTSIKPTDSSIAKPSRGGMTRLNRTIAAPTRTIVIVWPMPQSMPMSDAWRIDRCPLTMVLTAITWSGSVACRIPKKKPTAMTARKVTMLERSQKPEVRMKLVDCAVREQAAMPPGADSNRRQAEFPLNLQGVIYFSPAGAMLSTLIDLSSVREIG